MSKRFPIYGAAAVFLKRGDEVFLMRRANTGYRDGTYGLPAGHTEEGEALVDAAARELLEEVGVTVEPDALKLAHALYRRNEDRTYADYYFVCEMWQGEPRIMEPEKCDAAIWVRTSELPAETVPEVRHAWACIARGEPFSDKKFEFNER